MKYQISYTSQFKKDVKLARKQGRDMNKLVGVVNCLVNGEVLDSKYRDHALSGNYDGFRECHVAPDWLLIYKYKHNTLVLALNRLGSHSDLF